MFPDLLPMNAAALMDRVFDLYKATFKTQIAFSLVIGIISFVLMMILGVMMVFGLGAAINISGTFDEHYIVIAVLIMLIGILPLYVGWMYLSASGHILISKQAFYNEPIELPFKDALKVFLRVMSSALAQILLSAPWLALLALIIYFAASGYDGFLYFMLEIHPIVLILSGLAFTLFYVVYSNLFALSIPVAIFEGRLFFASVSRSFQLLKGDFWRILGLRILWIFLIYLFSTSAQGLIVAIVALVATLAGTVINLGDLWVATGPLQFYASLFAGILVGPMEGIMTALIYFNQKIKKDGLDIEISLRRLAHGHIS